MWSINLAPRVFFIVHLLSNSRILFLFRKPWHNMIVATKFSNISALGSFDAKASWSFRVADQKSESW